jgi:hypothetical protein
LDFDWAVMFPVAVSKIIITVVISWIDFVFIAVSDLYEV